MKTYNIHVNFDQLFLQIKASNKREAREKLYKRLSKKSALSATNKSAVYIDEIDDYYAS